MEAANGDWTWLKPAALLAGLEAGIVGVLGMLTWLSLASLWYQHSLWAPANLMASTFYGDEAFTWGFTLRTFSGLALYLIIYGLLGAIFGLAVRDCANRLRVALIAVLTGLAWYYLWFGFLWKALNPLIPLYTHDRPMLAGHVLYGFLLGRFPKYLRSIQ